MILSEIRIKLLDESKLRGIAKVTFDDCFVVRDLKIILGSNGYFVAMPGYKLIDGTYKDIAHPTNKETRKRIEDAVLKEYITQLRSAQPEWAGTPGAARQMSMGGD